MRTIAVLAAVGLGLAVGGCASVRPVPIVRDGNVEGAAVQFAVLEAAQPAVPTWAKWTAGIGAAVGVYLAGDNNGWWEGGGSRSSSSASTASGSAGGNAGSGNNTVIITGNYGPVSVDLVGDDSASE